jgi:uncharacterized 2Fe-2S/4Fe-4S cluster protein (DUF4445 family)
LVISGNSVMAALLTGSDVSSLASAPYEAPAISPDISVAVRRAGLLGDDPVSTALVVPPIASFVGGDLLSGMAATGLFDAPGVSILVDIGTNAEVAVVSHGAVTVVSAPAGPAFEGGGIRCGGPALPGAVSRVVIGDDGSVRLDTIGHTEPRWFSGAGLVSAIAALRRAGHIDASGLLGGQGVLAGRHFVDTEGISCIRLGDGDDELVISQLDIRALQLAKAAVRVAIDGAVTAARVKLTGVSRVYVSGAFGAALTPDDLVDLGVVPGTLAASLVAVGNTSLAGAVSFAADNSMFEDAIRRSAGAQHVELTADPDFGDRLMSALELSRTG